MEIAVKLYASFRINRFRTEPLEFPEGTRLCDVAAHLAIPSRDLGIVLINGKHAALTDLLSEGDTVSLMPRIGGG